MDGLRPMQASMMPWSSPMKYLIQRGKKGTAPNVCHQFGVRYQDTYAMLSDLDVQFEWKHPQ